MNQWFKRLFFTVLFLLVGYVLTVQVLRWIAFGDEESEALAVMEVAPVAPAGESGFKYLAYTDLVVPEDELDAALAADLDAFIAWHATAGERFATTGDVVVQPPQLPSASRYPPRAAVAPPDVDCGFRDEDCLAKLRGQEDIVRTWLDAEAERLALAEKALAAGHFLNPYPHDVASPLANFRLLRLPLNDIALQALEGDVAGALPRACALLANSRRHLRNDGMLIEKIVTASLAEGAGALLADLRALDPTLPLPGECNAALEPVTVDDYQVCGALRTEYAMLAELSRQTNAAMDGWRLPARWVLYSDKLQRAWSANHFAPMCTAEGQAAIARGEIPQLEVQDYDRTSINFWAAPISHILASIASPAYGNYQQRLLDHAEALRGHLAAIIATQAGPEPQPES
ncbi:hypothetical protein [uncultured Arenimonas sp.]|uniref:hypothetical protein n=1 Tax=uncultured Arenimonas sp. TaxID=546226 RepID=UPI0030DC770C